MLGTAVNILAIIVGVALGLALRKGLPERVINIAMQALGLGVVMIGIEMGLATNNILIVLTSIVAGAVVGELIGIECLLERLGERTYAMLGGKSADSSYGKAFLSATLLFCVGAMAIVGALQSGLEGRHDILYAKSLIDGITAIMLTSTLGPGVLLSVVPVGLYQGGITLLAGWLEPFFVTAIIAEMKATGGLLIIGIGLNLLGFQRIKVGNMLPAILFAMILAAMLHKAGFI
ncbi:MAG: DUF554 domain-containing protein [Syntrophomonadaceae bacterium]|nr:DUF554 domain-containing protein [Syntrophomonadaceae bacterium]